jgi:hypothetical protein
MPATGTAAVTRLITQAAADLETFRSWAGSTTALIEAPASGAIP